MFIYSVWHMGSCTASIGDKYAVVLCAQTGMQPLHIACKEGHSDVATMLVEKGALLDATNINVRGIPHPPLPPPALS